VREELTSRLVKLLFVNVTGHSSPRTSAPWLGLSVRGNVWGFGLVIKDIVSVRITVRVYG